MCVVAAPDEYSGELPLAFVVPSGDAQARLKADPKAEHAVRKAIMKVRASNTPMPFIRFGIRV